MLCFNTNKNNPHGTNKRKRNERYVDIFSHCLETSLRMAFAGDTQ